MRDALPALDGEADMRVLIEVASSKEPAMSLPALGFVGGQDSGRQRRAIGVRVDIHQIFLLMCLRRLSAKWSVVKAGAVVVTVPREVAPETRADQRKLVPRIGLSYVAARWWARGRKGCWSAKLRECPARCVALAAALEMDLADFAKEVLRWSNPYLFAMLFLRDPPRAFAEIDATLGIRDPATRPAEGGARRRRRAPKRL